ncbi:hypothetical protein ACWGDX_03020 [Streptomyces sp. NPDC055025]
MAGMGPAPKPAGQRARRNATVTMTKLPATGRIGRTPPWPLLDDVRKTAELEAAQEKVDALRVDLQDAEPARRAVLQRKLDATDLEVRVLTKVLEAQRGLEKRLWRDLWKTPQAVAWEKVGWSREPAQYVRWKVLGELGDLDAAREARQLADRLGLTPLALLRLRWEIVDEEPAAERAGRRRPEQRPLAEPSVSADPRAILHVV